MKRYLALAAVAVGTAAVLAAPSASAAPALCVSADININGTPVVQELCTPEQ